MSEIQPALPALAAVHTGADVAEPLPGMVMGDGTVAARREHGLRGTLFIGFSYLMGAGSALSAALFAISGVGTARSLITGLVWGALQWRLATEVRRFSRWGWYGAMAELTFAAATKLFWMFRLPETAFMLVCLLMVNAVLLQYFWTRRAEFDVSLGH